MNSILVIDADDKSALALVRLLRSAFYDAERSADGFDAVRRNRARRYDLIVTDVSTERGLWRLRKLVRDDPDACVLVVARGPSAASDDMLRRGEALGAADALRKPIDAKRFLHTVADLLLAA